MQNRGSQYRRLTQTKGQAELIGSWIAYSSWSAIESAFSL